MNQRHRFTTIALLSLCLLAVPMSAIAAEGDLVDVTFRGITLVVKMPALTRFRFIEVDVEPCKLPPAKILSGIRRIVALTGSAVCEVAE